MSRVAEEIRDEGSLLLSDGRLALAQRDLNPEPCGAHRGGRRRWIHFQPGEELRGRVEDQDTQHLAEMLECRAVPRPAAARDERARDRDPLDSQTRRELVGKVLYLHVGPDTDDPGLDAREVRGTDPLPE